MSADWNARFIFYIASVFIHAYIKLSHSLSDVLMGANCTLQEVDDIFRLAVGSAVYDEWFFCICAPECVCALDVFARHTSAKITFVTLTNVGRSRGRYSSHHDTCQTFGFPENKENNKIIELRTILQRESQNSYLCKQTKSVKNRKTVKTVMTLTWYRHF